MNAHFCPRCGTPAIEGARFCASCGTDFTLSGPPGQAGPPAAAGSDGAPKAARSSNPVRRRLLLGVLILLAGGVGGGALLISAGILEPLRPLEAVTFETIDDYPSGRQVTLAGDLSLPVLITCDDSGRYCPVELVDAEDSAVGPGHPRTMIIYVDPSAIVLGTTVQLTSGGSAETGAFVRVTGRVCRTTDEPPEVCVVVEQIASASEPTAGGSPGTSAPTPTPTPTPVPVPTEETLVAACYGSPVPGAAPYAGKIHPLVVVDTALDGIDETYAINKKWLGDKWPSPIQLVVCAPDGQDAGERVRSCGRSWKRTDGVTGELLVYKYKSKIRVVVAETGKNLQSKTLFGSVVPCIGGKYSLLDLDLKPPWKKFGFEVTDKQVNQYATAVSEQKVK